MSDYWGWVEAATVFEPRAIYAYRASFTSVPTPGFRPKLVFVEFNPDASTWTQTSTTNFNVVADDTEGDGKPGGWGPGKLSFVYLREEASTLNVSIIDASDSLLANWTTSDLVSLAGYTSVSSPMYVPHNGNQIAFMAVPSGDTVRHLYFINASTGAIEADLVPTDFATNPYTVPTFIDFAISDTHLLVFLDDNLPGNTQSFTAQLWSRVDGSLVAEHPLPADSVTYPQFSTDYSVAHWVSGNNLYVIYESEGWTTLHTEVESGNFGGGGPARFMGNVKLSDDNTTWFNSIGTSFGAPSNYRSELRTFDASFNLLNTAVMNAFGSTTYQGDIDQTGQWWTGGQHNINGNDVVRINAPFATADVESGSGRSSNHLHRPFHRF